MMRTGPSRPLTEGDNQLLAFLRDEPRRGARSWAALAIPLTIIVGCVVALTFSLPREWVGATSIVLMLALLFMRVPVAFAMLLPALIGMYALRGANLVESMLTDLPYASVANWTLSVLPLFILMGLLLVRAGLTTDVYVAGKRWLGWLPGGLAVATNTAGAGLAAVTGSTIGTTFALARSGLPEMLKAGYDKRLAIGSVIAAGLPGQLIPPSILMVIYAGIAEVPVGPQLLAGIAPGLLIAVTFAIVIVVLVTLRPGLGMSTDRQIEPSISWRDRFVSLVRIWPVPVLIAVIIVGMFSGAFTATEAGALAAIVAVVVAVLWRRKDRPLSAVGGAAIETVSTVGAIFLLLIGVEALTRLLSLTGISSGFGEVIESLDLGRIEFLLLMMVIYLVLGTFMESLPMILLTVPILIPTLESLDISLIWFGVFVVFLGEIAILSPPVGILAFIIHRIAQDPKVNGGRKIKLNDVFVSLYWVMPVCVLICVLLIVFPEIATTIPSMFE